MESKYAGMKRDRLLEIRSYLQEQYGAFQARNLHLNMARGKPEKLQLDLSVPVLDVLHSGSNFLAENGEDCRNYGFPEGLPEAKRFFADLMEVDPTNVIVGGSSSLTMEFDIISCGFLKGFHGCTPWGQLDKVRFLCPAPGYDRHFSICEFFGIEMITVPMLRSGPDMDMVERYVQADDSIKGIWCVPKYSNPLGITFSDETVKRFAKLKPAAQDFKIFWDNAYLIHDLADETDEMLNIFDECGKYGNEDLPIEFCSTSKITFPGSGVAALAASFRTLQNYRKFISVQSIGPNKLNQLRHLKYFKDMDGLREHMQKHRKLIAPKFQLVLDKLKEELGDLHVADWTEPNGGYFISVDVLNGCAKKVVSLCKEAGVILTGAGATFPYKNDPNDCNIRVAPTFPPMDELNDAMDLFCLTIKMAAVDQALEQQDD